MRFNKLFYQIFLVFILVVITCLSVSGWFLVQTSEDIVTRKISEADQNFARRIAQNVAARTAGVKPTLTVLSQTSGVRHMEATQVKGEIDRVQRNFPEMPSIYVADLEGQQIARTGSEELGNVSNTTSFQVARGGDTSVSDIYVKQLTSEPMQTIALPIIDNGTVVGVLSAEVSFSNVMVSVMGIYVGRHTNVVVVADNGIMVAHTRMKEVAERDLSKLPVVAAVLNGEEGTAKGYTDELGQLVLGSYVPVRELGWGVLIQRPLADIDAEIGKLRTEIFWFVFIGIALSVLAGVLVSRKIAKPIQQLATASERVARGDLSTAVDVKSSNEVGVLGRSFNQMIVSLKKSRDELEREGELLRQSEEKYRSLAEGLKEVIYRADPETLAATYVNNAIESLYGYTVEEWLNDPSLWENSIHPDDKERVLGEFTKAQRETANVTVEYRIITKNKTVKWVQDHTSWQKDQQGKVTSLNGLLYDITERKQAEEQLLHTNIVLETLRNVNQLITRERDSQSLIQKSCELLVEKRGYSRDLILLIDKNRNFIAAAEANDLHSTEAWSALLGQLKRGIYPRCFNEALKRDKPFFVLSPDAEECKDCEFAYARLSDSAFIDRLEYEGKVYGVILTRIPSHFAQSKEEQELFQELVNDIAFALADIERAQGKKQAEEALRESERRYRELADALPQCVCEIDAEGNITYANSSAFSIFGYSSEDLEAGLSIWRLIIRGDQERARENFQRVLRGEDLPGTEYTAQRKDGSTLPVLVYSNCITFQGKPAGLTMIAVDITERKKMEEQLIVSDRLASIGELVSGVAHELNNPLTGVIGFSDLLMGRKDLPDDVKRDIKIINREAQRTANIVRNLLTFARKHPKEKQLTDVNRLIESVLELRAYEQKVNNIHVNTQLAPDLPDIMGNTFDLQQVFLNIIVNAEHAILEAHKGGTITITTERDGDIIRTSVADEGPGISEENIGHVFDPFFTTKDVGKGTGLGLSICHGIITEHGGKIYAESKPGEGATFIVELPLPTTDEGGTNNENSRK